MITFYGPQMICEQTVGEGWLCTERAHRLDVRRDAYLCPTHWREPSLWEPLHRIKAQRMAEADALKAREGGAP